MKKNYYFILVLSLFFSGLEHSTAQSRKYISQFSHLQNYYNPALTGYEGSVFRGFVRNQWVGFDDAPKTLFLTAEVDFAEIRNRENAGLLGKHAMGLTFVQDQYGPFDESEIILSYASRIRLTKSTNLRLGAGVNYGMVRLDGFRLNTRITDDPTTAKFIDTFSRMSTLDVNIGLALTHQNYYISYGIHNVNQGGVASGDVFWDKKPMSHIVQGGYRQMVDENVSIITNFMFRSQEDLPENIEFNVKGLLLDKFWVGAGHRINYSNNFQLGFMFSKINFGYIYEVPMSQSYLLPQATHEFMMTYSLFKTNTRRNPREVLIW